MDEQELRELVAEANATPNTCWGKGYDEAMGYYQDESPLDRASAQPVPSFPSPLERASAQPVPSFTQAHEDTWSDAWHGVSNSGYQGDWSAGSLPFMHLF